MVAGASAARPRMHGVVLLLALAAFARAQPAVGGQPVSLAAAAGTGEVWSGADVAALLSNASITIMMLMVDLKLLDSHFQGFALPIVVSRNVVLDGGRGSGAHGGPPTLDYNFVANKAS